VTLHHAFSPLLTSGLLALVLGSVLSTTAIGVRLRQLPMNPSGALEALWAQQKSWKWQRCTSQLCYNR
jgi:hypothetical protein